MSSLLPTLVLQHIFVFSIPSDSSRTSIEILPGHINASKTAGCFHNGSTYANGSLVPTVEPCLNCKCQNNILICALRVCPEQPIPPPRGCVLVQKKSSCCSYLTCTKLHAVYKGQDRRVIAYDRNWYDENVRHRIFSENSLLRRIGDNEPDTMDTTGISRNGQSKSAFFFFITKSRRINFKKKTKTFANNHFCSVPIFVSSVHT